MRITALTVHTEKDNYLKLDLDFLSCENIWTEQNSAC